MTITITDAALGLAETACGIILVGGVVALLFGFVVNAIRDSRVADRDAQIWDLEDDIKRLERRLEASESSVDAARDRIRKLTGQIDQVAVIFGWEEVEEEGQS